MNLVCRICLVLIGTPVLAMNASGQENRPTENAKVEIYLLERQPISGVTSSQGLQLSESGKGPLSYVHKKAICEFNKDNVVACTKKKVGFGSLPGHGWRVNIRLTKKAKAELIAAMKTDAAKKAGWFIITLNGEKQPGEHTTGYVATGFDEIGIAYYRTDKEAAKFCNAIRSSQSSQTTKQSSTAVEKKETKKPTGIDFCLIKENHVPGITQPHGVRLTDAQPLDELDYPLIKPAFTLTAKHVKVCGLKASINPYSKKPQYDVCVELNNLGRAEMYAAFKGIKDDDYTRRAGMHGTYYLWVVNGKAFPIDRYFRPEWTAETIGEWGKPDGKLSIGAFSESDLKFGQSFVDAVKPNASDPKKSNPGKNSEIDLESKTLKLVIEKLARMKPDIAVKSIEKPNTAPILLYTVDGSLLEGKPASICDIHNCRIAILGEDITATRTLIKKLNARVAGKEAEEQAVKSTKGDNFFVNKYENGKAQCRFHDFEFELTDRLLSYGARNDLGFRSRGTLWSNRSNVGVLILVDSSTGTLTTHPMRPMSKRVVLPPKRKQSDEKGK